MAIKLKSFEEIDWEKRRRTDDRLSKLRIFLLACMSGGVAFACYLLRDGYRSVGFSGRTAPLVAIMCLAAFVCVDSSLKLFRRTGRYFDNEPVTLLPVDRIPLELHALVFFGGCVLTIWGGSLFYDRVWQNLQPIFRLKEFVPVFGSYALCGAASWMLLLFSSLSIYRQAKNKKYNFILQRLRHGKDDSVV